MLVLSQATARSVSSVLSPGETHSSPTGHSGGRARFWAMKHSSDTTRSGELVLFLSSARSALSKLSVETTRSYSLVAFEDNDSLRLRGAFVWLGSVCSIGTFLSIDSLELAGAVSLYGSFDRVWYSQQQ